MHHLPWRDQHSLHLRPWPSNSSPTLGSGRVKMAGSSLSRHLTLPHSYRSDVSAPVQPGSLHPTTCPQPGTHTPLPHPGHTTHTLQLHTSPTICARAHTHTLSLSLLFFPKSGLPSKAGYQKARTQILKTSTREFKMSLVCSSQWTQLACDHIFRLSACLGWVGRSVVYQGPPGEVVGSQRHKASILLIFLPIPCSIRKTRFLPLCPTAV